MPPPSASASQVQGVLLYELTPEEMVVFDEFEGDEYYKEAVQPQILDASGVATGNSAQASVYLWQRSLRHLLIGDWDPELFEKTKLESYVGMCTSFIEELREQQGRPQNRPLGFQ